MNDDFFDDESELMELGGEKASGAQREVAAAAASAEPATPKARARRSQDDGDRQAPPFWMVLAIAAIALILGVVIGYLVGTQATLAELSAATSQTTTTQEDSATALPEGHPQLNIAEDGTATVAGSGSSQE